VSNIYVDKANEMLALLTSIDNRLSNIETQGGYVHTQAIAATQWTIIHNLERSPGIFVTDNVGNIIEFDRSDPDFSTSILTFSSATAGKAVCS
jgi:hypothetical protein